MGTRTLAVVSKGLPRPEILDRSKPLPPRRAGALICLLGGAYSSPISTGLGLDYSGFVFERVLGNFDS